MQRQARRSRRPKKTRRLRLNLEPLEQRLALSLSTVASFSGSDPYPGSGVVMDAGGNLYGATSLGGTHNDGTVFEIAKGTSTVKTLASFDGDNGSYPDSYPDNGMLIDQAGNLYGTCQMGGVPVAGTDNLGTVFEVVKGSGKTTELAGFDGSNTGIPDGTLVMDGQGNLYGTALAGGTISAGSGSGQGSAGGSAVGTGGGSPGNGVIYEVVKGSHKITILAPFNGSNGSEPSGLAIDKNGNLFGTTGAGGGHNDGTVFELAKGSHTIKTLATFNGTDGKGPNQVIIDSSGNLYGTTLQGAMNYQGGYTGDGTVFELAKGSSTIKTLAKFDGSDGINSEVPLAMDSHGNLYGSTSGGGSSGDGTLFEVAKGSGKITQLASFNSSTGPYPSGVIIDGSGNLYGTTSSGGAHGDGRVFKFAPLSATAKTVTATVGATFSGVLATFSDAYPGGVKGDFTATINWGDGTTTSGTITTASGGGFAVTGSHIYAEAGTDKTVVTIDDSDGGKITVDGTAKVIAVPATAVRGIAAKDAVFAELGG